MLTLLEIILPVFIVIGAGYIAVRTGYFADTYCDALMKYTQGFAIPCLLFNAVAKLDLPSVFLPELLFSFYAGALTSFVLAAFLARTFFGRTPGEAVAIAFAALFSNSVLLGLPIMERAYGVAALEANFAIVAVHAPFCYILGITSMEFARADGRSLGATVQVVSKAIFTNPLMIGIGLGFLANVFSLQLPSFAQSSLDMVIRSALPAALFGLGGILVRYGLAPRLSETLMICVLSLGLHPTIAYVLTSHVFHLSDGFVRSAVITAAMAPGINTYVFANMYDRAKDTAASAILIGTTLSIVTVSIWLWILGT